MGISRVGFSVSFLKQYKRAPAKIRVAWIRKLEIFKKDFYDPQLNNHQLKGKLLGHRSINITGNWRAVYSEHKDETGDNIIIFELLGTHSQLYA